MILDANLKGPFVVAQVFLPLLKEAGGGAIIHIGSVSGQYGGPRTAHYAASKAGLISLAQVIARFGAQHNVRSNTVAAGLIASEMAAGRHGGGQRAEGGRDHHPQTHGHAAGSGRRGGVPGVAMRRPTSPPRP